jgi:hypothetical protein
VGISLIPAVHSVKGGYVLAADGEIRFSLGRRHRSG